MVRLYLKHIGIRKKLVIAIAALIAVTVITINTYFVKHEKAVILDSIKGKSGYIARNLAYNAEYYVLTDNKDGMTALLKGVMLDKDVIYCAIYGASGNVIVSRGIGKGHGEAGLCRTVVSGPARAVCDITRRSTPSGEIYYNADMPVISQRADINKDELGILPKDGAQPAYETIGIVSVGVSSYGAISLMKKAQWVMFMVMLLVMAGAGIATVILSGLALRPLRALMLGTTEIARGNLKYSVPVTSKDEFGELAASFNKMAKDLNESMVSISVLRKSEEEVQKAYAELKRTQMELVSSEKMAALGRFSTGIAHEVKNPLGIILGGAEYLESKLSGQPQDVMLAIAKMKESVVRANEVLRSFLVYARPSDLKKEILRPDDIIREVVILFRYRTSLANIRISIGQGGGEACISADKNQLHQAIFNLVSNSVESMPKTGGEITIRSYIAPLGQFFKECEASVIEVADTGAGIVKENLSKLAEPFFTTKERKAGTGLGLFIVKAIMDNHGGILVIDSVEGKGTAAKMAFRRCGREGER